MQAKFTYPEILAPVGDREMLATAIRVGADAVFFGTGNFHARSKKVGLNIDELPEIIAEAHSYGVKTYLTLNTLIRRDEMAEAFDLAVKAYVAGIDAIIVQDLGLTALLHKALPNLVLHASTQMGIYTKEAIKMVAGLGIKRIVLPREYSLEEIIAQTEFAASLGVETEVFVHGALCVCYSGHCHLSQYLGGRSANRGECAQPCRLSYKIEGKNTYFEPLLSPKDISYIDYVDELKQAGVASFKIEGRMRSKEYVFATVKAFRQKIYGGNVDSATKDELLLAFNRGGSFSQHRLLGERGKNFLSGKYAGNHGIEVGKIISLQPTKGIIGIIGKYILQRGDIISIRNLDGEEIASVPIGSVEVIDDIIAVKGFHPEVIATMQKGLKVFKMRSKALSIKSGKEKFSGRPVVMSLLRKDDSYLLKIAMLPNSLALDNSVSDNSVLFDDLSALSLAYGEAKLTMTTVSDGESTPEIMNELTDERLYQQLNKLGNSGFRLEKLFKHGKIDLKIAQINALRRSAIEDLQANLVKQALPEFSTTEKSNRQKIINLLEKNQFEFDIIKTDKIKEDVTKTELRTDNNQAEIRLNNICGKQYIYFPGWRSTDSLAAYIDETLGQPQYRHIFQAYRKNPENTEFLLPLASLILYDDYANLFAEYAIRVVVPAGANLQILTAGSKLYPLWKSSGLIGQITSGYKLGEFENDSWWVMSDANIMNDLSLEVYARLGCEAVALANELDDIFKKDLAYLQRKLPINVAYIDYTGLKEAMIFEHCPVGFGNKNCNECRKKRAFYLVDKRERRLKFIPLPEQNCSGRLYFLKQNSAPVNLYANKSIIINTVLPE